MFEAKGVSFAVVVISMSLWLVPTQVVVEGLGSERARAGIGPLVEPNGLHEPNASIGPLTEPNGLAPALHPNSRRLVDAR